MTDLPRNVVVKAIGTPVASNAAAKWFRALVLATGLCNAFDDHGVAKADPTMHDLRHTYCYYMANGLVKPDGTRTPSVPLTTLCRLAGHATIAVTAQYYVDADSRDLITAASYVC